MSRVPGVPRALRIEARAKLNLGLAVGARRADGFHDLATVFQSISLADTLVVRPRARGFTLRVRHVDASLAPGGAPRGGSEGVPRRRGSPEDRVPSGRGNLVLRAARLLAGRYRITGGADFELIKRIPSGAGLGGGSADAAAALSGLARLNGLRWSRAEQRTLAAELGADVPFMLLGGTALGTGRGDVLVPKRLVRPFQALVAMPAWRVETARAYRLLDRSKYGLTGRRHDLRFLKAFGREAITAGTALRLGNTFEKVLGERRSSFLSLRTRLRRAGVREPHLTGSGSAVFGLIPAATKAERIVGRFVGHEAIYLVRSRGTGLTHYRLR